RVLEEPAERAPLEALLVEPARERDPVELTVGRAAPVHRDREGAPPLRVTRLRERAELAPEASELGLVLARRAPGRRAEALGPDAALEDALHGLGADPAHVVVGPAFGVAAADDADLLEERRERARLGRRRAEVVGAPGVGRHRVLAPARVAA